MRAVPRILYLVCFIGLAWSRPWRSTGWSSPPWRPSSPGRSSSPACAPLPVSSTGELWPLAVVLLPVGCYLLLRTVMPLPPLVEGVGGQYQLLRRAAAPGAARPTRGRCFPCPSAESGALQLLLAFSVYWLVAAAAFLALSLRRPLPAVVLILVLLGFGLTVDTSGGLVAGLRCSSSWPPASSCSPEGSSARAGGSATPWSGARSGAVAGALALCSCS